ncbi:MAG: class I SAM-dependent methyltransferase [Verrucomicrobia bacterium]|nr:class I SAM-dependent methyltransferase [Verrucomicrobiota bacterium]
MRFLIPLPARRLLGGWWHEFQTRSKMNALLKSLQGSGTKCNVCGWEGRAFTDDQWHPGTICPLCGSQVRHRMLAAALDGQADIPGLDEKSVLTGKAILHFAPERQLRDRVSRSAGKYVTADYDRGDCDLKLDISAMPSVQDRSFDVVISCDVLEHVPDDLAAMREIRRILRPGGTAILTVPQMDPPAHTDEDPSVLSESGREIRFGQKDHVRMYGDDFVDRLRATGFEVDVLTSEHFSVNEAGRMVLAPPVKSPSPLATNCRRIYFARKPSG